MQCYVNGVATAVQTNSTSQVTYICTLFAHNVQAYAMLHIVWVCMLFAAWWMPISFLPIAYADKLFADYLHTCAATQGVWHGDERLPRPMELNRCTEGGQLVCHKWLQGKEMSLSRLPSAMGCFPAGGGQQTGKWDAIPIRREVLSPTEVPLPTLSKKKAHFIFWN